MEKFVCTKLASTPMSVVPSSGLPLGVTNVLAVNGGGGDPCVNGVFIFC